MIHINQKFPRCTICGRMLPPRAEPIRPAGSSKTTQLCSEECLEIYEDRKKEG